MIDQTMILEHLNLLLIRGTLYSGFQFITFLGVGYNYEGIREKRVQQHGIYGRRKSWEEISARTNWDRENQAV